MIYIYIYIYSIYIVYIVYIIYPVSKVIEDRNHITIQQVFRLQSWGYVLITITDFDSITIVLQSMLTNCSCIYVSDKLTIIDYNCIRINDLDV